jgi:hypothetical protein
VFGSRMLRRTFGSKREEMKTDENSYIMRNAQKISVRKPEEKEAI